MITVHEIRDASDLDSHQLAWKSLHAQTPHAAFLQSFECWRAIGRASVDGRMGVLLVEADGRPFGLLPFAARDNQREGGSRSEWTTASGLVMGSFAPLGANPTATYAAALRHLAEHTEDWNSLELAWIERHGPDRGRAANALRQVGMHAKITTADAARIEIAGASRDELHRRIPAWRDHAERALSQRENVEFIRLRPVGRWNGDDDPRWELFDECAQLSTRCAAPRGRTWGNDVLIREIHAAAVEAGALDLSLLRIDDRLVAFMYSTELDGRVDSLWVGYESDTALVEILSGMIDDSCRRGDRHLTFPIGSWPLAAEWSTSRVSFDRYEHHRHVSRRLPTISWPRWARR